MGFLTKLFGKKETSKTQNKFSESKKNDLIRNYEELVEKTEALQKENSEWQTEFDKTISLRQKAQQLEKENKFVEAISLYLNSIEEGENSKRLNINNYAYDIERVIILYSKTKQKAELKRFLEEKIKMYPDYRDSKKWAVRLSKLNNEKKNKEVLISPNDIIPQKAGNPTIGQKINKFKQKMPEFNFYYNLLENSDTLNYNHNVPFEYFKKLREYRESFEAIKSLAKIAENEGDYKKAIEAYKKMIIEEYEGPEPYERLMIIYAKLKWVEEEKKIVEQAIKFYSDLKEIQLNNVLSLAKKYNMTDKAMEYINQGKKIFYYGGAFELYNPQSSRLEKWNKRLEKISDKMNK
jgi:tetratricopeptide (TPR) repeat protein